jgi:hypothetical protein
VKMGSRLTAATPVTMSAHPVGTLLSVNVGMPKDVAWQGNTVHTGVFKSPVAGRRRVGRLNAIVDTFAPDGYYTEPIGPHRTNRGADELRSFFTRRFSVGGGIGLTPCVVTHDRVAAPSNTTAPDGAARTCRRRRVSRSTNADRTDCSLRLASTTTSNYPTGRR